jgi:ElaB/YqjD/DUF883 family membrane-anchored ribosome-binding protein
MYRFMQILKARRNFQRIVDQQGEMIERQSTLLANQSEQLRQQSGQLQQQFEQLQQQSDRLNQQSAQIAQLAENFAIQLQQVKTQLLESLNPAIKELHRGVTGTESHLRAAEHRGFEAAQLEKLSPHLRRNFLPNDSALAQKHLMATWFSDPRPVGYSDLLSSGFRVFSQNDEDGVLLRIFSKIGLTNRCVIEIGSNCSDSDIDIPENLSTNLIVNHGWHGVIFEMDSIECARMRHFFARDFATKHFHVEGDAGRDGYFSPLIIEQAVSPQNIEDTLRQVQRGNEPDLLILDIDGGDYAVAQSMVTTRPRVLVLEFEKRFRDRHSVVQPDRSNFSRRWAQSGAASLPAWMALIEPRGYTLCGIGSCGFNAFFVRSDVAAGKILPLTAKEAFDGHPILSSVPEGFWLEPDETWQAV